MHRRGAFLVVVLVGATLALLSNGRTLASHNRTVQHQGRLTDSNGVPLEGTVGRLCFRLYSTAAPTSASFLWGEVHENVAIRRGVYTCFLGAGTKTIDVAGVETAGPNPFETEFEGGAQRFIQVQVEADAPLSPLAPIGSVPHALSAVGVVPLGGIMAWWPAAPGAAVPEGFEFCDGGPVVTPGSPYEGFTKPDLMSTPRVPRGLPMTALGSYGGGASFQYGGADSIGGHTHSLPNHRHLLAPGGAQLTTSPAGAHDHSGLTGKELHREDSQETFGELYLAFANRDHDHVISTDGEHTHQINAGTVTGDLDQGYSLSGGGHDNRPAFVSLAYIIRVK